MKKVFWLLFLFSGSVIANGVHVDDIEYQPWLNVLIPQFNSVIRAVELANNAAAEVDDVQGSDTTEQFCNKLFPTSGATTCDTAGEEHYDITDSLEKLANSSSQMYNCATNQTCNSAPRLTRLRRNSNEVLNVTLDKRPDNSPSQYQQMFDTMVERARGLLSQLLDSDILNDLSDKVEGSKTDAQLCAQWFTHANADCTVGGGDDREIDITVDLKNASGAMDSLFDCANDVACGASDRFGAMRQFVEVR